MRCSCNHGFETVLHAKLTCREHPLVSTCAIAVYLFHSACTMSAQDNNLAEALKARNLLAEFDTSVETTLAAPPARGGAYLYLVLTPD